MTILPEPTPPGPTPGVPGHFDHHDWLKEAAEALEAFQVAVQAAATASTGLVNNTMTQVKMGEITEGGSHGWTLNAAGLLVVPEGGGGLYFVVGRVAFPQSSVGWRSIRLDVNGATTTPAWMSTYAAVSGQDHRQDATGLIRLAEGDTLAVAANHNIGVTVQSAAANIGAARVAA